MIAVAIMASTLVPIFYFLSASNTASRLQKAEGVGANLAKEELNRWLYVYSKTNFDSLSNNTETDWSLGNSFFVEGNQFQGKIMVRKITDSELQMVFPKVKLHNFQACTGGESNAWGAGSFESPSPEDTVANIAKTSDYHLADIILKVKWRLPNDVFKPTNQLILVTRRAFL